MCCEDNLSFCSARKRLLHGACVPLARRRRVPSARMAIVCECVDRKTLVLVTVMRGCDKLCDENEHIKQGVKINKLGCYTHETRPLAQINIHCTWNQGHRVVATACSHELACVCVCVCVCAKDGQRQAEEPQTPSTAWTCSYPQLLLLHATQGRASTHDDKDTR